MKPDQQLRAPSLDEIRDAAEALAGVVGQTPLLENLEVNRLLGGRLLLKAENMQRTGAFKIRGAYFRILQMSAAEKARGVITYSSGNHAQGVALAANILGTSALIVMPNTTPKAKIDRVLALGAMIEFFDRETEFPDDAVVRIQQKTGRVITPPSEDSRVLAGAGTVALEILAQADAPIDAVLAPCGSGGIVAATNIVFAALSPKTDVLLVEPEQFDDTRRSLIAGKRLANPKGRTTICDAIMTPMPNAMTFEINQKLVAGALTVRDDQVRTAMLFAFEHFKIVVEPGAAVGLAAVLFDKYSARDKTTTVILTGGNIDADRFSEAILMASPFQGTDL